LERVDELGLELKASGSQSAVSAVVQSAVILKVGNLMDISFFPIIS
jgi:hypothetical protein